jgi:alkyl hydroperoxide reductase subunit F
MLDPSIQQQLVSIFSGLQSEYIFQIVVRPDHPRRNELTGLLEEVAASSGKFRCVVNDGNDFSFTILRDGVPSSIHFRAVPTGHEFTTLLLAILNMEGKGKNLPDEAITRQIRSLKGPVLIQSYISLTCTNCPDVVQSINVMAILNPEIRHEVIDGALFQQEAASRNIQAVPSVFVNGELLHVGRAELGELLAKIIEKTGANVAEATGEIRQYDVIVAGGGPAGATSAIYSARKGLKVAVVADHVGGQLTETLSIDNMISIPHTTGNQLAANLREHMKEYTLDLLENRKIVSAAVTDGMKQVKTSLGEILVAPALIIATGASWRRLNVPGESRYIGAGVAFCAHCDGPFYKGKRVAVIGGGNSGLEAAIDLSGIASEVTVLEFLDELKGDQVLQDKIAGIPNIRIIKSAETVSIDGDDTKVTALQYRNRLTEKIEKIDLDGVFVQIGLKANSQIFCEMVEVNRFGEIVVDAHCRTSIPGIYAAGDVTTVPFKQIVIAMGEGSKAALSAFDDRMKDKLLS